MWIPSNRRLRSAMRGRRVRAGRGGPSRNIPVIGISIMVSATADWQVALDELFGFITISKVVLYGSLRTLWTN